MAYAYDDQNIFAKILRGEIPNDTVLETEHSLAFRDIAPKAPVHVLVIPKGPYMNLDHFFGHATADEITDFARACSEVAKLTGIAEVAGGNGFRAIANTGPDGVQEVPHYHLHLMGGRPMGSMVKRVD